MLLHRDWRALRGANILGFASAYEPRPQAETGRTARVATLTGSIVAGPEGTLIVDIGNFRGMIQPGEGGIATDGPLPEDSNMSSCTCFGLGPATKTCSDENCDVGLSCGKNRACRWATPAA